MIITLQQLQDAAQQVAEALDAAFPHNVWTVLPDFNPSAFDGRTGFLIHTLVNHEQFLAHAVRMGQTPEEVITAQEPSVICRPKSKRGENLSDFAQAVIPTLLGEFELALEGANVRFPRILPQSTVEGS